MQPKLQNSEKKERIPKWTSVLSSYNLKFAIFCFFLFFLILFLNMINTSWHEITHENIFERYGCNPINIEYSFFRLGGTTIANCSLTEEKRIEMKNIHEINDMVAYNFTFFSIFFFIILLALFYFIYLSTKELKKKEVKNG